MRVICPCCFGTFSLEAAVNDQAARNFAVLMKDCPKAVSARLFEYLGLFRQGDRGLSWRRAESVTRELFDMIKSGDHSWDGKPSRFISPEIWAEAIDAVLIKRPTAMTNHNYLRHTAYDKADPNRKKNPNFANHQHSETSGGPTTQGSENTGKYKPLAPTFDRNMSDEDRQRNLARAKEMADKLGKGMSLADPNKPKQ